MLRIFKKKFHYLWLVPCLASLLCTQFSEAVCSQTRETKISSIAKHTISNTTSKIQISHSTKGASKTKKRAKIGLALGGGGAKGAAHVGVLKVLESQNIPIDYIAGTNVGAVVGGLYSAGVSLDYIEEMFTKRKLIRSYLTVPLKNENFCSTYRQYHKTLWYEII